jgi:hypothetical protein
MWLFTKHGFYSIVHKPKEGWHVRARRRSDLEAIGLKPL